MNKTIRPTGGHILDIDPSEVADQFLSVANNVNTRKGFPSRVGGRRIAYPVSGGGLPNDPLHLLNLQLNTFNWWMSFGASTIKAIEGTNFYDISAVGQIAVTDSREWVSTLLNGIPVFTNGKNSLLSWNGVAASPAVAVPDWPAATICRAVVAFKFHLFALNIDGPSGVFDNMFLWSDAADPGALPASWTPGASNEAGSAFCADTVGKLITGVPLNTQLLLYKPTSIYAVEYVGQQPDNIFSVRCAIRSLGTLGPHCVRELGSNKHITVGNDDVVLFDGINAQSIAENRIKISLANSIDKTYADNSFIVRDLNKKETWICIPESGSQFATLAHIWDERRDTWVTRDLVTARYGTTGLVADTTDDDTWDSDAAAWDTDLTAWNQPSDGSISSVLIAEADKVQLEDTSDTISVTSLIGKYDLPFDDDTQSKFVKRFYVRGTGLGFADIEFRFGTRDSTDANITWQAWQTMSADGAPCEASARYISVEVRVISDAGWTINKLIFDWKYNGPF
jgi:hypothetical protein